MLLASFTVGLLAENTEQNLIADINNKYTHSRRFRRNVSHLHVLLCLDNSLELSFSVRPQIVIRRVTAFIIIIKGVCKCDIGLIQQINKQVLHDFTLYHQRKIVPDKLTAEPLRISKSKKHSGVSFMNELRFPFSRSLRVTSDDRRNWDLARETYPLRV